MKITNKICVSNLLLNNHMIMSTNLNFLILQRFWNFWNNIWIISKELFENMVDRSWNQQEYPRSYLPEKQRQSATGIVKFIASFSYCNKIIWRSRHKVVKQ